MLTFCKLWTPFISPLSILVTNYHFRDFDEKYFLIKLFPWLSMPTTLPRKISEYMAGIEGSNFSDHDHYLREAVDNNPIWKTIKIHQTKLPKRSKDILRDIRISPMEYRKHLWFALK
jgi:hypothetical protein